MPLSAHRTKVLQLGTQTKLEILNAYAQNTRFGHDCARQYIFEVAEAVALQENRERAAALLYEIADLAVGKLPLPAALYPPPSESKAGPPKSSPKQKSFFKRLLDSVPTPWLLGFFCGYVTGRME